MAVKYPFILLFGAISLLVIIAGLNYLNYKLRNRRSGGVVTKLDKIHAMPRYKKLSSSQRTLRLVRFGLLLLLVGSLIMVASRPTTIQTTTQNNNGLDVMIVFDASGSMIDYFNPVGKSLNRFVDKFKSDRLGMIIFSGEAQQVIPMTDDYTELHTILSDMASMDPLDFRQDYASGVRGGTDISTGLYLASVKMANIPAERTKVVVLVSDGEQTYSSKRFKDDNTPIDTDVVVHAAQALARKNVRIIALETPGEFTKEGDNSGPELLQNITSLSGGAIYNIDDASSVEQAFNKIDSSLRTELAGSSYITIYETPWLWLSLSLVFLVAYLVCSAWSYDGGRS